MPGEGGPLTRISKAPGKHAAVLSPDERYIADVYSYTNKPPDLYVQENRPQQELEAPDHFALARIQPVRVAGSADRDGSGARRRQGSGAPLQARQLHDGRPGGDLRARLRLSAERGSQVVQLLPRVHVPPHPDGARLPGARRGLSRLRRLRPRLAHRGLPAHGRQGSRRYRGCREVRRRAVRRRSQEDRPLRRQLRRLHHADGDVHRSPTSSPPARRCVRSPIGRPTTTATRRTF